MDLKFNGIDSKHQIIFIFFNTGLLNNLVKAN